MIGTIVRVVRGEGPSSAAVRAGERVSEAAVRTVRLARGAMAAPRVPKIVNLLTTPAVPRLGGVAVQLNARLAEERRLRDVALFEPGLLTHGRRAWRMPAIVEARAIVADGGFAYLPDIPNDADLVLVIHDGTLLPDGKDLLRRARMCVFPSPFLRDEYLRVLPHLATTVIETGMPRVEDRQSCLTRDHAAIAFVGAVKPHKGGALIPDIVRAAGTADWHVFGGGDVDLLRAVPRPAKVHGYYRAGTLPRLLARYRIGLAITPSIVPESFSLTLSECWSAGVPVVAFDHGAIAERVRAQGGGFLAPLGSGAEGIAACVREWRNGATIAIPTRVPTARDAAAAHVALYRELGIL